MIRLIKLFAGNQVQPPDYQETNVGRIFVCMWRLTCTYLKQSDGDMYYILKLVFGVANWLKSSALIGKFCVN